jgi:hypothetical protein
MKFCTEDFMARKKKRPSLKAVVKAIARTTEQVEELLETASPARKKQLKLKLKSLGNLNRLARLICRAKNLSF